ncbi:hypothetical protein DB44_DE00050 [Candidatus Protochlamydia amoebophila]|uniref:Uncharacterized protein n=1 Tax=Candidatus Protochlamydia amoebophila TaxID=362787 RepID=A0A0C1H1W0_9BACT|nr:hypothetical protein DB44_DE00050 [Candidatus Protochlamydia amoebophila]
MGLKEILDKKNIVDLRMLFRGCLFENLNKIWYFTIRNDVLVKQELDGHLALDHL